MKQVPDVQIFGVFALDDLWPFEFMQVHSFPDQVMIVKSGYLNYALKMKENYKRTKNEFKLFAVD